MPAKRLVSSNVTNTIMFHSNRLGRRRNLLPLLAACALLIAIWRLLTAGNLQMGSADDVLQTVDRWRIDSLQMQLQREVWTQLAACLEAGKPTNGAPRHKQRDPKWNGIAGAPSYKIDMPERSMLLMQAAHKTFLQCSQHVSLEPIYSNGTRGIVTTAGGKYVPLLLVSLRLLRKTGSTLPVEVFLADDSEYEPFFCDVLLPSMNARCRVLSHTLSAVKGFKIKSYQFKILSILFSSFEDVLFLDADNIPLNDPDTMFDKHPYQGYGMVLWPDFWRETVCPQFYDVQGTKPQQDKDSQRTSETGQILVSKRLHQHTLILSSYYNIYGPRYYYSLLSQGGPGEGDKETFSVAADYHQAPYYVVERKVEPLGYFDKDRKGSFVGQAMLQFDPTDDFEGRPMKKIKPVFIHANFPKFDPFSILNKGITSYKSGEHHRIWHDIHKKNYDIAWGSDPEPQVWQEMLYIACNLGDRFQYSKKSNQTSVCADMKKHYLSLFGRQRLFALQAPIFKS